MKPIVAIAEFVKTLTSEKYQTKVFKFLFAVVAVVALIGAMVLGRVDLLIEALLAYGLSRMFKTMQHLQK